MADKHDKSTPAANDGVTWMENPEDVIVLVNKSQQNFILELPAGRYRLDAGRRMRTLRSILKHESVMELIHAGKLAIE